MFRSWVARVVVLLGATAIFGILAVTGAPDGASAIGIWPVGLASATLLVTTRPPTVVVISVVGLIAVLTIAVGRDLDVALGLGIGIAVETAVVWRIYARGVRERPHLRSSNDLARLVLAATVGAGVGGVAALLTSIGTGWGDPPVLALALFTSNLASQLTLLPIFSELHQHLGAARPAERAAQWLAILVLGPVVFAPLHSPSFAFVVIPVLAWCALRTSGLEALFQLLALLGIAVVLTTIGHGPFADAGPNFDLSPDMQGILLATFVVVCALVVVPLMLAVGEQIEGARQAAAERDRVQRIVDGITNVAIIGADELTRITLFNPGAERLLGYDKEEVLGATTRFLHSAAGVSAKAAQLGVADDFSAVAQRIVGTGTTDMGFVRKDGVERMHSMSLSQIKDDRGQVIGYVSTSEDITDRVEAERKLLEALETERQAVERLREVDQVKDAFVSSVSHELRTPITSILGYIEMLEDGVYGDLEPAQLDAVRRVAGNSTRLLSLIDDLLTLSRIQEGGLGFVDRVVDLRKIVTAGCGVVTPSLERRELVLDIDLPEEPVPFLGDRDMLERVVINLVGNAVKFTPEGGRVAVALAVDEESAVIEVTDTGIGIPKQEQEQLFSRFFRSSLAQERAIPGSGLGLSIAHAIVEQHGGTMVVESEPGSGTTFRVALPVLR